MYKIYTIAGNTLKETIKNKIVYFVIFLVILGFLSAQLITPLTMGEQIKIIQDLSVAFLSFFSVLLTILMGAYLIKKEMDEKTIHIILSKPIKRYEFILGKFLGLVFLEIIVVLIISAGMFFNIFLINKTIYYSMWYFHEVHYAAIAVAVFFIFMQLIILNAVSIFFSVITSSYIIGTIFTFIIYLAGLSSHALEELAKTIKAPLPAYLIKFLYYLLPNFGILDLKNQAIYGFIPNGNQFLFLVSYALLYTAFLLLCAMFIFEKKELV